jgi:hypothetical protein
MNARGWSLQDKAQLAAVRSRWDALSEESKQICQRDDLRAHYSKSPCNAKDPTLEQLADKSKISPAEKEAYVRARSEQLAISKKSIEYIRQSDPVNGNSVALAREHGQAELDKVALDFIEGRITRGEFNRKRRDIVEQTDQQAQQVARAN